MGRGGPLRATPDLPIEVVRAGTMPYLEAWGLQRELVERRRNDEIGDTVLVLEHPPVYTLGSRADESNIVFTAEERAARGIEVIQADRGGDVTYHGPGQLIGYPIMKLAGPRVVDFVRALEQVNIEVLATLGLVGERIPGYTGVWVGRSKITAIGVRVSAGYITQHGWATNVASDLDHFAGIVACGITDEDKSVGTLKTLGIDSTVDEMIAPTMEAVSRVFEADVAMREHVAR